MYTEWLIHAKCNTMRVHGNGNVCDGIIYIMLGKLGGFGIVCVEIKGAAYIWLETNALNDIFLSAFTVYAG